MSVESRKLELLEGRGEEGGEEVRGGSVEQRQLPPDQIVFFNYRRFSGRASEHHAKKHTTPSSKKDDLIEGQQVASRSEG